MKLGFSEFSYGYAFTENLVRASASGSATAPVFPNLVQEAQLGYDVAIDMPGVPLFVQFKLPELMTRQSAREIFIYNLRGLSCPFFRMPLMRRDASDLHRHLIRLEVKFPKSVFYASTRSKNIGEFNLAYVSADVHLESALFSPSDIGQLPDDKQHNVSYSPRGSSAWRCSEPKKIKLQRFSDVSRSIEDELSERKGGRLDDMRKRVREGISDLLPGLLRDAEQSIRRRIEARQRGADKVESADGWRASVVTELLVQRELVRVGLGVDLLIAQPRDPKAEEKKP